MSRALIALLILVLTFPARAFELPGMRVSHPCRGRAEPGASWTRYVDGFLEATYDLDLGSDGSRLSKLLQLRYDDGTVLYVDIDDIKDARWAEEVIDQAIRDAAVCDSGRLFPREMNRGTTPRLHAAKAEVLRIMDDYNSEFILGHAFPAVFLIVTSAAMPGMTASSVKRRALPGRMVRSRGYTAGSRQSGFTADNFRANLAKLTGKNPDDAQAHHIFPQQLEDKFSARGIDIHDPRYGAWWAKTDHLRKALEYNERWKRFMGTIPPPTAEKILQFGRDIARSYGLEIHF